jgi:hypothetical protein
MVSAGGAGIGSMDRALGGMKNPRHGIRRGTAGAALRHRRRGGMVAAGGHRMRSC